MRLHIGCGNNILENYINIDITPVNADVNNYIQADAIEYIQNLSESSVDEIKSELFMEHLTRTQACRLLYYSHQALKKDGVFDVTVPVFNPNHPMWTKKEKNEVLLGRKLYGVCGPSEPDSWGYLHKFIYDKEIMLHMLDIFGFHKIKEIPDKIWGDSVVRYNVQKAEKKNNFQKYRVEAMKKYEDIFKNVYIDGKEDEYCIHQIGNREKTIISEYASLFRTWFTIKPSYIKEIDVNKPRSKCVGFFDSWYFSKSSNIPLSGHIDIVPFSTKNSISGFLDYDFSKLSENFINNGFVNNEIRFVKE